MFEGEYLRRVDDGVSVISKPQGQAFRSRTFSSFDLETGRLCVMASRHQSGLVILSRDHVPETLESHIPRAERAIGRPDVTGQGHERHLNLWEQLQARGQMFAARR